MTAAETLRDLRDAVRGTEIDYTQGSLGRAILRARSYQLSAISYQLSEVLDGLEIKGEHLR